MVDAFMWAIRTSLCSRTNPSVPATRGTSWRLAHNTSGLRAQPPGVLTTSRPILFAHGGDLYHADVAGQRTSRRFMTHLL